MVDDWDAPTTHRVMVEDRNLEPLEGDDMSCTSAEEALRIFAAVLDDPDPDLGSVYVTELTNDDVRVIATHTFVSPVPSPEDY